MFSVPALHIIHMLHLDIGGGGGVCKGMYLHIRRVQLKVNGSETGGKQGSAILYKVAVADILVGYVKYIINC